MRRAGDLTKGARDERAMGLENSLKGEACLQTRRERNLGICWAIGKSIGLYKGFSNLYLVVA